ncbi:MAG: hypothetical protein H6538_00880 [Bacteroidales bacterium]|nr:hypothetical protein [Bacteroidales bacterium]MCB8999953.1 hypothetical protein [Bacteroidales bacterium]MCB9012596.1 hypothetical protein [Bacteroidales bacterium]
MKELSNWLLISGSGRNVGKTSLICAILNENLAIKPVAVKISSHLHDLPAYSEWIIREKEYSIIRENSISSKDSSKMLQAGADEVFYAQGADIHLTAIMETITGLTSNRPVVCESGGLRNLIVPGVYILVKGEDRLAKPGVKKLEAFADLVVSPDEAMNGNLQKKIFFKNNSWYIKS